MEESSRLTNFKKATEAMVQVSRRYDDGYRDSYDCRHHYHDYTVEQAKKIIKDGSLAEQITLSRAFFDVDGFYKRILIYYATLLKWSYLLIPNPASGKSLSNKDLQKRYRGALQFIGDLSLEEWFTDISLTILRDGAYYGAIKQLSRHEFLKIDLPPAYCRNYLRDAYGNDIVEFNVGYFDTIPDKNLKQDALSLYPKIITQHYHRFTKNKTNNPWVILPGDIGFCFKFFGTNRPLFLNVIPSTIQYDEAVDTERERDVDELRKILVQRIPHNNQNELLFEPEEALEMHKGAVEMMKSNKGVAVLTTYADVDSIVSKTTSDAVSDTVTKMVNNIYYQASVSPQIFAPTGTKALDASIKNDISLMMGLANQFARFVEFAIKQLYTNANISFSFKILPVSHYTESEYITDTFKLAQSGYSYLLPCIAAGINQHEISGLKELENDVLKLQEKLIPLSSAYTQSASTGEPGRPELDDSQKDERTIANEVSLDKQEDN